MILRKQPIRRIAIAVILSSAFVAPASRAADHSEQLRGAVDRTVRPLMAKYDVPGMAVAVTVDGQTSFYNYGVASREEKTPVSETTLFEIGSISKTFAATLGAYAQALGKLSLDDHPGKYVPQLQASAINRASLLNLGTYTAGGLPLQVPDQISTDAQMLAYFQQWKPEAAPGTQRQYSNPSIGLFGQIAALALQGDFAEIMEQQVFPRLGLRGSYIRVPGSAMANYAWGYDKANKPIRMIPGVLAAPAYGVRSTTADMIRFVQANIAPDRLEASMRSAVDGTHVGYFRAGDAVQGIGWEQYPYPVSLKRLLSGNSSAMIFDPTAAKQLVPPRLPAGPTLFNKTGSTNGFGAYVAFVPEKKIGIVILANKNFPIPARIEAAHAILEQLARTEK
ncbi:beta-lactamase class C [Actimicrobium sp. GrIS 1.19]|nr:beta-lactamase class C [Actimicrobium sp. GrIS 1.19]